MRFRVWEETSAVEGLWARRQAWRWTIFSSQSCPNTPPAGGGGSDPGPGWGVDKGKGNCQWVTLLNPLGGFLHPSLSSMTPVETRPYQPLLLLVLTPCAPHRLLPILTHLVPTRGCSKAWGPGSHPQVPHLLPPGGRKTQGLRTSEPPSSDSVQPLRGHVTWAWPIRVMVSRPRGNRGCWSSSSALSLSCCTSRNRQASMTPPFSVWTGCSSFPLTRTLSTSL